MKICKPDKTIIIFAVMEVATFIGTFFLFWNLFQSKEISMGLAVALTGIISVVVTVFAALPNVIWTRILEYFLFK